MKSTWKILLSATLLGAVGMLGSGCGGVAASPSVSPLSFLLPGFVQNDATPAGELPSETAATTPAHQPAIASVFQE